MDDLFPSSVQVFTGQSELSEDKTIPNTILRVIDPSPNTVFVFDRGVSSRKAYAEIDAKEWKFVTRMKTNSRYHKVETLPVRQEDSLLNNLLINSDELIQLYDKGHKLLTTKFRLVKTTNQQGKEIFFLSNLTNAPIADIISIYKERWRIEVFFRFIKQELNFSHFMSTNINGIKIVLYMTLILSMLIYIYKKANGIGYKTAKRRVALELDELITIQIVIACGGNPNLIFRGP